MLIQLRNFNVSSLAYTAIILSAALAKGMEIGRKEGEAKAKAELVRKMIDAGMNPEQIGQITGLDISEIQAMA